MLPPLTRATGAFRTEDEKQRKKEEYAADANNAWQLVIAQEDNAVQC